MSKERWMQGVANKMKKKGTEGVFSAAAHRAGMSTQAFAHKHDKGNSKLAKRARMAERFAEARHKK